MDRMQRVPCFFCSVVLCCLFLCLGQEEECKDSMGPRNCLLWATTQGLCSHGYVIQRCPVTCNLCGPCAQKPCASDEKCISKSTYLNGTYTCVCADGYTNGSCSESVCVGVTVCQNGGTCMVDSTTPSGYRCACRFGFAGTYCQECTDSLWECGGWAQQGYCTIPSVPPYCRTSCPLACPKCIRMPCQNGGTCDAKENCNCTGTGFTGKLCEVNELCIPNPCNNGGVCTTNATCNCTRTGFMGQFCEVPVCSHEMEVTGYRYREVPVPGLRNRSSLAFSIQACADAHLTLSTSLDLSSKMVELVIGAGGNTNQQIRLCRSACLKNSRDGSLLSCSSPRNFWLSWESTPLTTTITNTATNTTTTTTINTTTITLGLGNVVGSEAFLSSNLGKYLEVNHMSIASYGTRNGSWAFDFPEQVNPRPCPTTTLAMTTEVSSQSEVTSQTTKDLTSQPVVTTQTTTEVTSQPVVTTQTTTEVTSQPVVTTQTTTELTSQPVVTTQTTTEAVITTETSTESPSSTATEQLTPSHLTSETPETTPSPPYVETTSTPEASTSSPTSPETSAESTTQPTSSTKSSSSPSTTTTPKPPSPPQPPPTQPVPKCRCRKAQTYPSQVEMAKAEEAALQLKKNLTLTNTTSAQKRSKTSAHDHRPSAQTIGGVGISVLVFVFLLIVVPDLFSIGCWCRQKLRGTNKEESRKTSGALIIVEDYDKTNILPKEVVDRHVRLRQQMNQFSKAEGPGNALVQPVGGLKSTATSSTRFNNVVPSNPGGWGAATSLPTICDPDSPPESA